MCRKVSEGGQRCAAHTREKVATAVARIEAAATAGDMDAVAEARASWETAASEFASTNEGRDLYRAQAAHADAAGDVDTAALLGTIVARGEAMRAANRATATLLTAIRMPASMHDLPTPPTSAPIPSTAEMTLAPAAALGRNALSTTDQETLDAVAGYLDAIEPYVRTNRRYFRHGAQIQQAIAVLGDPTADDVDLSEAVATVRHLKYLNHFKPDQKDVAARFPDHFDGRQQAQKKFASLNSRWERTSNAAARWLSPSVLDLAMDHPNAGEEVFRRVAFSGAGDLRQITARAGCPVQVLKEVLMKQHPNNSRDIADAAWQRLREARLSDNSVAMVLAMSDPVSYQRNEAVITLEMADMDSFSREERTWLAGNLDRLPGGPEKKVALAASLTSWAKGFGDAEDRREIGFAFRPGSGLPVETVRFHEELAAFDRPEVETAPEKRRGGWLSR